MVGQEVIDGLEVHVLATCLAGLHEVDVVLEERCVEHADDVVVVADVGHGKHVLERYGLTADEVGTCLNTYKGDVLGTLFLDDVILFLLLQVLLLRLPMNLLCKLPDSLHSHLLQVFLKKLL